MWTPRLVQTDITDPATGEPLYVYARIRPRWYWTMRKLWLFVRIVWRPYEGGRIAWRTAWDVAFVSVGLTGPKGR